MKHCLRAVMEQNADDLAFFDQRVEKGLLDRLTHVVDSAFERVTYSEAIELIENSGEKWEYPVKWGSDLQSEHERWLAEKKIGRPVVVMDYPKDIKAFYMRMNEDGKTVAAMDILAPGVGEIIGGSQREERLDALDARLDQMNLPKEDYWCSTRTGSGRQVGEPVSEDGNRSHPRTGGGGE